MKYDYLIVGAGLFGAVCANELTKQGRSVLVIDRRQHIGGNVYTEDSGGIQVHKYGAHIFHTNDKAIWDYVNDLVEFNRFTNSPLANHKGKLYNLPFNMNTFYQLWGVRTPAEAEAKLQEQRQEMANKEPENLEEQAISLVGRDIYETLIKGYTEKQWGRDCVDLPAFIIRRLPVRLTYDNNYFSDRYQGVPIGGYTNLIEKMLENSEVQLGVDFLSDKARFKSMAKKVIYTGPIDEYFDNQLGRLEYRSLEFQNERMDIANYQGNAVVNYTERSIPFTRIIEHKHFDPVDTEHTIITKEYPSEWKPGDEPYYPVNDEKNMALFKKYRQLAKNESEDVFFGGRLAEYKYYDMHQVIRSALNKVNEMEGKS
ncbi:MULTISPECIES: UDP-galactopyranose mutase [Vibrio]|uniref:UDP-galactopyranose mutase n=1 Tax=Vibrio natriegens NBRC 15636 = ATCC 14048 = DSM 759 TaxID=1219067 RepID=A0AAN1CUI2_VIBNA|nr:MULTISPECIES: UDP-galactopyranose mutase [Vibrio]AEX20684.1 UDP-galactopyranose mutase [Vibrio sp. EJY3]ALR16727.1 UDP-galactopyranose mutase [Vibrio natriegens NBRC 15636 = ATCC 14048 = DSM 759]ANQ11407.1 UDP-galactopyranose mutase [Vibrio natriegens NBRC 15636 = ATCC 14048 = DSM 759]EPM38970.1 UDP-galactopyranose mutase [Vibrio natriegens NBRC 15636 = ATCC 14048 = DSM 759]MDX6025735.1 UDP-galactopyranose mutase [Vibrio natriegens NBRC 15636 = ATCC 14048 = DSM 759]